MFDAVASANVPGNTNVLVSMSAVNANDVWAVGYSFTASTYDQTLVEHFDGTSWSIVPSINPGSFHNDFNGVVAISSNDVWVVGEYTNDAASTTAVGFAVHWNGSSWNSWYVLRPHPTTALSTLVAITATSSNNVWAVGNFSSAGIVPYLEHWDGVTWTPTTVFFYPSGGYFNAISAWSSTDIWAVGAYNPSGTPQAWALHGDGTTWTSITPPNSTSGANVIFGVNALEANHAVGIGMGNFVNSVSPRQSQAWDLNTLGTSTTSALGAAGLGTGDNALVGVSRSGSGLQAVGYKRSTAGPTIPRTTLAIPATWDSVGHTLIWGAAATSASPGGVNDVLYSAAALSPLGFWAAGYTQGAGAAQTLTELYCGLRLSVASPVVYLGEPFSITVTAQNPNSTTMTGYRGTVQFTSTDPKAVLPADYTFTPGDAGTHVFNGVVLNSSGLQTITVSDAALTFVTFTTTFNVSCRGACPGPGGTAGARDANSGPAGTAGSRDANQSGASSAGPRRPTLASGNSLSGVAPSTAVGLAPSAGGAATTAGTATAAAAPIEAQVAAVAVSQSEQPLIISGGDMMAASRAPLAKVEDSPGYPPLVLIPLAIIAFALLVVRRLRNRRLIGHTRP